MKVTLVLASFGLDTHHLNSLDPGYPVPIPQPPQGACSVGEARKDHEQIPSHFCDPGHNVLPVIYHQEEDTQRTSLSEMAAEQAWTPSQGGYAGDHLERNTVVVQ